MNRVLFSISVSLRQWYFPTTPHFSGG